MADLFPLASEDDLRPLYVGQLLDDIPTPAAIIDQAKARQNCRLLLTAAKDAGVSFRAHVKTHKTKELTRLQVGEDCKDVRLVVSTLVEAEQLVPMLLEYKSRGAAVNVLYGVPLGPSQSGQLGAVGKTLGSGSISAMIDDVGQLAALKAVEEIAGFPPAVFVKIDTGYHRAGRESGSGTLKTLLAEIQAGERAGILAFQGYYSHASESYGNSTAEEAMCRLIEEVQLCAEVGRSVPASLRNGRKPVISVGASPTAVSIQNVRTGELWRPTLRPVGTKS